MPFNPFQKSNYAILSVINVRLPKEALVHLLAAAVVLVVLVDCSGGGGVVVNSQFDWKATE